eukprot:TRINITY_DN160_c0_g1_i1.p1 TRINITY_DN160_c0_g1~~TRINITY_DN160_c0_g1_i1.p1  ORF type:complete len:327 (-),score=50.15 TRINITY_DN160_c0_g1_i1:40-1020(-)
MGFLQVIPHTVVIVSVTVAGMAMMKMAQDPETKAYPFSLLAVAFWVSVTKLFISLFMYSKNKGRLSKISYFSTLRSSLSSILSEGRVCFKEYLILAVLYLANDVTANFLLRVVHGSEFALFRSLTTIQVALLSTMSGLTQVTLIQGVFLFVHALSMIVTQVRIVIDPDTGEPTSGMTLTLYSVFWCMTGVTLSSVPAFYNGKVVKKYDDVSMHAQNFMLYLISLVLSIMSEFIWSDWESPLVYFLVKGMFPWGFSRAFLHAIAGIVISFIYKSADPIVKTLAVSVIVPASMMCMFVLGFESFFLHQWVGAVIVSCALFGYSYMENK